MDDLLDCFPRTNIGGSFGGDRGDQMEVGLERD